MNINEPVNQFSGIYANMADELDLVVAASAGYLVIMAAAIHEIESTKGKRMWVKPWIIERPVRGAYNSIFNDLLNTDESSFRNFIRMDKAAFEDLLSRVEFRQCKADTGLRMSISARERLCILI